MAWNRKNAQRTEENPIAIPGDSKVREVSYTTLERS